MRRALARAARAIDRANEAGAWAAAAAAATLALLLLTEVVATGLANWSQPWAVEYSAYLCAMTLFGGTGYALRAGAHIRVAWLLHNLPPRVARALDLGCTLLALWVAGFLSAGLVELAYRSYSLNSVSYFAMKTPLWVPQAALAVSVCLLALALLARALRLILGLAPDDPPAAAPGEGAAE